jgi:hypothetical protein
MKVLFPKAWTIHNGNRCRSFNECGLLVASGRQKKSFLIKFGKSMVCNSASDAKPGILERLHELGLDEASVISEEPESGADRLAVGHGELFWMMFNARMTHEGLLDLANRAAVDGLRCCLVYDELSFCVSGAGMRIPGCITLDELIVSVDDNDEVTKGAASKIRRLRGAKISCLAGVQLDCLPEVFGGSVGRNIISRFTVIGTVR